MFITYYHINLSVYINTIVYGMGKSTISNTNHEPTSSSSFLSFFCFIELRIYLVYFILRAISESETNKELESGWYIS